MNYLYDKYNVAFGTWSGESFSSFLTRYGNYVIYGYRSVEWNGDVYIGNDFTAFSVGAFDIMNINNGLTESWKQTERPTGYVDGDVYEYRITRSTRTRTATRDTLAQKDIAASVDTFPTNGLHSDGFWYIRTGIENAPTITAPNGGESVNEGYTITFTDNKPKTDIRYHIQLSLNNGASWKDIIALTTVGATSYVYNFVNEPPTSTAKVRVRAYDGQNYGAWDESNGVFTIQHNVAPTMPTNLTPSGSVIDRLKTQPFTWKHNDADTQSKAVIEWRVQGTTSWTTYTSNGAEQGYFIAANTLPTGQIEWRVRTYDQQGLVSPYSAIAVFSSAEPTSAPTILMPADVVNIARPVIKWAGGAQASYQIVIEDSLGAPVWDTGEITSTNKAVTVGVDLLNGGTYTIRVRIKDASGLFSTFVDKTVFISYTPPVKPDVTAFTADGFIAFNIVAPTPSGTQPTVVDHEIYKRINDEWVRVAFGVGSTYNDYHVKNGVTYEYYVKAIGANGAVSNSDIVAQSTTFRGSWLHSIQDAEATLQYFRYNGTGYETAYEPESAVMKFAGRTRPVVHFGAYEDYSLTVRIQAVEGMSDMDVLRRFVRERETVCYRDADGNLIVGHILALNVEKEYRVSSAVITIIETDFNEEV